MFQVKQTNQFRIDIYSASENIWTQVDGYTFISVIITLTKEHS